MGQRGILALAAVGLAASLFTSSRPAMAATHHHHHHRFTRHVRSITHTDFVRGTYAKRHTRQRGSGGGGGIVTRETLAGPIRVAAAYAERFVGFINGLVEAGIKPGDIGCASSGHMRNSKHHWGGACDIDQTHRNVTSWFMRDITALAHLHGLTDGCEWRDRDCGHVEVPTARRVAVRHRHYRYAMR